MSTDPTQLDVDAIHGYLEGSYWAAGMDVPAEAASLPMVIKPRRGSDSIGVRIAYSGPVPADHLAQELVIGTEITVAVLHGTVGAPLRIELPPGAVYSFARKYVLRPRRVPIAPVKLATVMAKVSMASRIRRCASRSSSASTGRRGSISFGLPTVWFSSNATWRRSSAQAPPFPTASPPAACRERSNFAALYSPRNAHRHRREPHAPELP